MNIKEIKINEEIISKLEKLRLDAYHIKEKSINPSDTFYKRELQNKKYLVYGIFKEQEIIAACYISNSNNSLFIEQLFVKSIYQEKGLALGRKLLQFVLSQKEQIEKYYEQQLYYSKLYYNSEKSKKMYEKIGYTLINQELCLLRKKI